MTEHWKPSEFRNTYHEDLMRRIKEKVKAGQTKEITKPEKGEVTERRSAEVIDLAKLLRQSLNKGGGTRRAPVSRGAAKPRATGRQRLRVVASRRSEAKLRRSASAPEGETTGG